VGTSQQRDADVDRLLRAVLKPAPQNGPGECPDAGVLAAFMESGLTAAEQSAVETHLAGCGRCQEALSILSHDLPEEAAAAAAVPETRWFTWVTRPRLRWLVPISAAATVAVVIFATRPLIAPESQEVFPADVVQMAQAPAPPAASPAPGVETMREKSAAVPEKREFAGSPERQDAGRRQANPPAGAKQTADVAPPTLVGQSVRDKKAPAEAVAPQIAAAPAAESAHAKVAAATEIPAADAMRAMPATSQLREELRRLEAVATITAAPDGRVQWRLGPGGRIWRSTDAGSTWHWQPTDVSADLVAGSAPSATTCWAVGDAGIVLLTEDGQRWTPLPFPMRVDLAAVQATDSRHATVTTRDGRRFETLDAGLTWSQKQ